MARKKKTQHQNTIYTGDNLYILHGIDSETVDLIYLDPPFNSKKMYKALSGKAAGTSFKDMWTWKDVDEAYLDKLVDDYPNLVQFILSVASIHSRAMTAYLTYMTQRIIEMHRILKPTGCLYLHCDPVASHYLKIILDRIFGNDNFRNEVIWRRDVAGKGGKKKSKQLPRNHDVVLFYSKSATWYFDQPFIDLNEKQERAYRYTEEETGREYKAVQLGNYSEASIKRMEKENLIHVSKTGKKYKKYYLDEADATIDDTWTDILGFGTRTAAAERTGYKTQKPLDLLYRIIKMSTKPGDVVLDPFCGCATTCVAAQHTERGWIGIDISETAADLVVERLTDAAGQLLADFIHLKEPLERTDLEPCPPTQTVKERLAEEFGAKCNGCGKGEGDPDALRHLEIDHYIPRSKGGKDYYENYQLLCSNCNRIKGDRPMEYLMAKLKRRNEALEKVTYSPK